MANEVVDLKPNVDEMFIDVTNVVEASLDHGDKITHNDFSSKMLDKIVNSGRDINEFSK